MEINPYYFFNKMNSTNNTFLYPYNNMIGDYMTIQVDDICQDTNSSKNTFQKNMVLFCYRMDKLLQKEENHRKYGMLIFEIRRRYYQEYNIPILGLEYDEFNNMMLDYLYIREFDIEKTDDFTDFKKNGYPVVSVSNTILEEYNKKCKTRKYFLCRKEF